MRGGCTPRPRRARRAAAARPRRRARRDPRALHRARWQPDEHYARHAERGARASGPACAGVARVWRRRRRGAGRDRLPRARRRGLRIHPALLDACLQPSPRCSPDATATLPARRRRPHRACTRARPAGAGATSRCGPAPGRAARRSRPTSVSSTTTASLLLTVEGCGSCRPAATRCTASAPAALRESALRDRRGSPRRSPPASAAADALPRPARWLAAAVDAGDRARAAAHDLAAYDALAPSWSAGADYVAPRSRASGGRPPSASASTSTSSRRGSASSPRYRRLLGRFLEILADDGVLAARRDGWRCVEAAVADAAGPMARALRGEHPEAGAELTLTERCGGALAAALTGDVDPLELLFPGGSTDDAEAIYHGSPPARAYGHAGRRGRRRRVRRRSARTAACACSRSAAAPAARPRRVLPVLPAERTRRTRSPTSPRCSSRAPPERFRDRPFLRTAPLDIERDPLEPGLRGAELRHRHRGQRRARHRATSGAPSPTCLRLLAPGGAAGDARDDAAAALDRHHLRPDRRLVELHRPRPATRLPAAVAGQLARVPAPRPASARSPRCPATTAADGATFAANTVIAGARRRRASARGGPGSSSPTAPASATRSPRALRAARRAGGARQRRRRPCGPRDAHRWSVRPRCRGRSLRLVAEGAGGDGRWRGVVHCWASTRRPTDAAPTSTQPSARLGSLLSLDPGAGRPAAARAPTWLVTRGAQAWRRAGAGRRRRPCWGSAAPSRSSTRSCAHRCVDLDPADGVGAARPAGTELARGRCRRARSRTGAASGTSARLVRFAARASSADRPTRRRRARRRVAGDVLDELELRPLDAAATRARARSRSGSRPPG